MREWGVGTAPRLSISAVRVLQQKLAEEPLNWCPCPRDGGDRIGSWRTRRRALLRSSARFKRRGSTLLITMAALREANGPKLPSVSSDGSSTCTGSTHCQDDLSWCDTDLGGSGSYSLHADNVSDTAAPTASVSDAELVGRSSDIRAPLSLGKRVLRLGSDCCGLCAVRHSLNKLVHMLHHVFASDVSHNVKQLVSATCRPFLWYDTVFGRDVGSMPEVDVYAAGFPCQPFSAAGLKRGFADERVDVFGCCADYIEARLPMLFLLENVKGLLGHDNGQSFDRVLERLRAVGPDAYDITFGILNIEQHGIPQHRERLYLVGCRRTAVQAGFEFPLPLRRQSLETFLDPPAPCPSLAQQLDSLSPGAQARLLAARERICKRGYNPDTDNFVVDIDSSSRFMTIMLDRSPCFTQSRAR